MFTSKLHTSKFHIAHFQIPHCTLPNSTLHTSKCHIESGKNFKVHTGHRTRHRRHHQLKGRLVRRFCHHLLVLIPIMSSDSATSRDNKETLKACHISKNKDVALTCFSAHATSLVFAEEANLQGVITRDATRIVYYTNAIASWASMERRLRKLLDQPTSEKYSFVGHKISPCSAT